MKNSNQPSTPFHLIEIKEWLLHPSASTQAELMRVIPEEEQPIWSLILDKLDKAKDTSSILVNQNARLEVLLETMIRYTQLDFSTEAEISSNYDEIDGIALGLNTLSQEFAFYQQKIDQLNYELKQLLYRSSHDLRGPIASIHGLVEMLSVNNQISTECKSDFLELINDAYTILNNLSICSIISPGQINMHAISLTELINNWVSSNQSNNYQIQVEHNAGNLTTKSDPNGIHMILNVLLQNSITHGFSDSGHNIIKISTFLNLDKIEIIFEDNGTGIPEHVRHKIFDMFFRGNSNKKTTGLGLYAAKKMALAVGGNIEFIENEKLTSFKLTLTSN